jgi:hypothetical protein
LLSLPFLAHDVPDGAGQMLEKLRNGGLRGKAVIRL